MTLGTLITMIKLFMALGMIYAAYIMLKIVMSIVEELAEIIIKGINKKRLDK